MKTADEMKVRYAQQLYNHNWIRSEAVAKMAADWVKVLDEQLDAIFIGKTPLDTVSASANRFGGPPVGQDRCEVERLAADVVIVHFMNRGFNACRTLRGSTPHQCVEVCWK